MFDAASPMRWPSEWRDSAFLSLLKGTPIKYLLLDPALSEIALKAREQGLQVLPITPPGITLINGVWPGVKLSRSNNPAAVSAGPTGEAWVNTNGWKIRVASVLHPGSGIWVDAAPPEDLVPLAESYVVAIADAAMYGGRWIVTLGSPLAAAIGAQKSDALDVWRQMTGTLEFFSSHESWSSNYVPQAVVGVLSDFAEKDTTFGQEALNLLARTNTQYRIVLTQLTQSSLAGLKALLCMDADPPVGTTLETILAFVESGGLLIAGPGWVHLPGSAAPWCDNPRYAARVFGQGRIAIANSALKDPYLFANDSVVLISHRYDLLRFWNAGALGSFLTAQPDGKRALLQMLFFAKELNGHVTPGLGPDTASVRVAGQYKTARLLRPDRSGPEPLQMEKSKDAVELHLPAISHFAAVELES
jgi:hypothetical protein